MHVLKCKGTKYETTKKKQKQKNTHTQKTTNPPPQKKNHLETNMRLSKPFLNS